MVDLVEVLLLIVTLLDKALRDKEIMAAMEVTSLLSPAAVAAELAELAVLQILIVMVLVVLEQLVLLLAHLLTMQVADLVEQKVDMLPSLVVLAEEVMVLTIAVQLVPEELI
jgi:hypothetical protein